IGHEDAGEAGVLGPVDPSQDAALYDDADHEDADRRHDQSQPEVAEDLHGEPTGVGAQHVEDAVREVDDAHEAEHDGEPQGDEDQDAAVHQPDEELRVPDRKRIAEERQICWLNGVFGSNPSLSQASVTASPPTACTMSK